MMCGFSFTKAVLILAQTTPSPHVSRYSSAEYFLVVALERDHVCRKVAPPDVSLIPALHLACAVSRCPASLPSLIPED